MFGSGTFATHCNAPKVLAPALRSYLSLATVAPLIWRAMGTCLAIPPPALVTLKRTSILSPVFGTDGEMETSVDLICRSGNMEAVLVLSRRTEADAAEPPLP